MPREEETDPQSKDSSENLENLEEEGSDPSASTETTETSDGQGTDEPKGTRDVEWKHPRLKGRSPEEVERYIQVLEGANRDMNIQLNDASRRVRDEPPPGPDPIDEEYESIGFLDDPDKKLGLFEKRIEKMLVKAVEPFKQNIVATRALTGREALRQKYDDFVILEPTINQLIQKQGQNPETADAADLERLYFTAVGYATKHGIDIHGEVNGNTRRGEEEVDTRRSAPPVNPPNRRPSGAPPPDKKSKGKVRELTENERHLAREWGMKPEEYLELQEAGQDEVVEPGFSKENW